MSTTTKDKATTSKVGLTDEAKAAAAAKTSNRPTGPVAATLVSAGSLPKGMTSGQLEKDAVPAAEHRATTKASRSTKKATGKKAATPRAAAPRKTVTAPVAAKPSGKAAAATKKVADTNPVSGTKRLGSGGLGQLVRKHMEARRGEDLSPTQVAKALGRSSGAVANALDRLKVDGVVKRTSDKPRRYTAPKTAQAATGKAAA